MKVDSLTNILMVAQRRPSSRGQGYAQELSRTKRKGTQTEPPFDIWCLFGGSAEAESTEVARLRSSRVEGRSIQLQCVVFDINWLTTFSSFGYAAAHEFRMVFSWLDLASSTRWYGSN